MTFQIFKCQWLFKFHTVPMFTGRVSFSSFWQNSDSEALLVVRQGCDRVSTEVTSFCSCKAFLLAIDKSLQEQGLSLAWVVRLPSYPVDHRTRSYTPTCRTCSPILYQHRAPQEHVQAGVSACFRVYLVSWSPQSRQSE